MQEYVQVLEDLLRLYPRLVEQPRRAVEDDPRAKEEGKARGVWEPGKIQGHDITADPRGEDDGLDVGTSVES